MLGLAGCNTRFGASLDRPADPVVLTGTALPKLLGRRARRTSWASSWDGSAWHQVPVQVDERDLVNPGEIYHRPCDSWPTLFGTATPYKMLVYTPPPDRHGRLHLARHVHAERHRPHVRRQRRALVPRRRHRQAGRRVRGAPAGVDAATREEVKATDPLDAVGRRLRVPLPQRHAHRRQRGHHRRRTTRSASTRGTTRPPTRWATARWLRTTPGASTPSTRRSSRPTTAGVRRPVAQQRAEDHRRRRDAARTSSSGRNSTSPSAAAAPRTRSTAPNNPGEGAFVVNIGARSARSARTSVRTATSRPSTPTSSTRTARTPSPSCAGHAGLPGYGGADDYVTGPPA